MRIRFLVDGFNVYHSLKDAARLNDERRGTSGCLGTRWFDLQRLAHEFIRTRLDGQAAVEKIQYFSAYAHHLQASSPDRIVRHQTYIACLLEFGIEPELGRFKPAGRRGNRRFEEKETDVAIGVHMMAAFATNACDMAVLVSGDTDLSPAIRVARATFPDKRIGVIFPFKRHQTELERLADVSMKVSSGMCFQFQLPDPVVTADGAVLRKPSSW